MQVILGGRGGWRGGDGASKGTEVQADAGPALRESLIRNCSDQAGQAAGYSYYKSQPSESPKSQPSVRLAI